MKQKLINIPDEMWAKIKKISDDEYRTTTGTILLLISKSLESREEK